MNLQLLQQASQLDVGEQTELVEAIWDGIVSRGAAPPIRDAQKAELDRRLAEHLANPDDVIPWSEVKAAALAKISRLACVSPFFELPGKSFLGQWRGMKASDPRQLLNSWMKSSTAYYLPP